MQLEYSLLERTAEGELFPMAQAMGMGIMPWSPLKHGFLSGKFRRDNAGSVDTKRTAMGVPGEKDYVVIDALCAVADEVGATWLLMSAGKLSAGFDASLSLAICASVRIRSSAARFA